MIGTPPAGHAARTAAGRFTLTFTPAAPAIRVARETVGSALRAWGLDGLAGDAELVASELVTNALRHARSATVVLTRGVGTVTLEVIDDDPHPPREAPPDPCATHGRGLIIVGALTAGWGWRPTDDGGKCVWATFAPAA
ncbi:ATP-binding protein [Actinomadura atramentaria]|uniref:ATP-binding protein n=1 Tax=Actinomadura atramentaria TaxID=1990 RepID=UPI0003604729|nr:ATP-binding protein [Actinomadura atramentaria]